MLFRSPDYPKYAVWPDAYYITTNESSPANYAIDRAQMLAGSPATSQRFTAPALSGFGFQALTPADLDGATLPPGGTPGIFMRHRDTEAVRTRLQRFVDAVTDPDHGLHHLVAWKLVEPGAETKNLAFRLWAAGGWEPGQPCAVQVWSPEGRLVSTFDFDSPPPAWLPEPPAPDASGYRDRKSTRLNSSHSQQSRMPSSA